MRGRGAMVGDGVVERPRESSQEIIEMCVLMTFDAEGWSAETLSILLPIQTWGFGAEETVADIAGGQPCLEEHGTPTHRSGACCKACRGMPVAEIWTAHHMSPSPYDP